MAVMPKQKPGRSQQDYCTPACFLEPVKRMLGIDYFDWDFAADSENTVSPVGYFNEATNALAKQNWASWLSKDGWGWLNPPFADITPWARRCVEAAEAGGHIAFLVPASVGSNWFRDYVHKKAFWLALNGRISFIPEKPTWGYPKDCMLVLYGPTFAPGYDVWDWRK